MTTELFGDSLLKGDLSIIGTTDALSSKKTILIYFSAHWCPPCRGFTPVLSEAYNEYIASGGNEAEVVFVSSDNGAPAFQDYFGEMPWLAMPFEGTEDKRKALKEKFGVQGIPSLVALNPDGTNAFKDGSTDLRGLISTHKSAAFPMTPSHIEHLKAQQERLANETLKEFRSIFPGLRAPDGEMLSFSSLMDTSDHILVCLGDGDGDDQTYKTLRKTADELNETDSTGAKGQRKLAAVYLGWQLYNDSCDHNCFVDKFFTIAEGADLNEELKKKITAVCGGQVGAPHTLVLQGNESPTVVLSDPGCRAILNYGKAGYPWTKERMAELDAEKEKRIADMKAKQVNLQFLKGSGRDGLFANDGKEVKVDALANGDSNAVIGIYFSAHWCPPCRGFTPQLAKSYNQLKESGKPFEIVFLSSDKDDESFKEYFNEMPWLAVPFSERGLKEDLSSIFEVRGIPALVLLKPDGTVLTKDGRTALGYGVEYFPWGPDDMERGKAEAEQKAAEKRKAAQEAERVALEEQKATGGPVVKRLRGEPGVSFEHDLAAKTLKLNNFPTLGAPEMILKSGVLYYELTILKSDGIPQFGFASTDFGPIDGYSGDGVGDEATSWGVDGVRKVRWYDGSAPWDCSWAEGDVIGLAANIDKGKIAVSKNGNWADAPLGVVFTNEKIQGGVYPAFTGSGYNVKYNLDGSSHGPYTHAPPPDSIWEGS